MHVSVIYISAFKTQRYTSIGVAVRITHPSTPAQLHRRTGQAFSGYWLESPWHTMDTDRIEQMHQKS